MKISADQASVPAPTQSSADGAPADAAPLYVTAPSLPPLADLIPLLQDIWKNRILTNDGPYHRRFEAALAQFLAVQHVALVSNATLGLVLALKQSGVTGDVITTPFSFVGTSHAIRFAGLNPVFLDIDRHSLNLDPDKIEAALTPATQAILPVHCFGHRCDVERIDAIAERHGLHVIYDSAHAFGVTDAGGSILRHGRMSVLSFHATKVFTTFEGGAVVCRDADSWEAINQLKNFGIVDELHVDRIGMNAKMNEFSAALGLLQLNHIQESIALRESVATRYRELLNSIPGINCLPVPAGRGSNYYNFPILVDPDSACTRDELYSHLRQHGVFARRYFYPLISDLPMYRSLPSADPTHLPVAKSVSDRILCLPMFPDLSRQQQDRVVALISERLEA
jgi:dTDP-4-amino-4,6-dideoxygalactose transaminase